MGCFIDELGNLVRLCVLSNCLDKALLPIQHFLGVTDGGFASSYFSNLEEGGWEKMSAQARAEALKNYAAAEVGLAETAIREAAVKLPEQSPLNASVDFQVVSLLQRERGKTFAQGTLASFAIVFEGETPPACDNSVAVRICGRWFKRVDDIENGMLEMLFVRHGGKQNASG